MTRRRNGSLLPGNRQGKLFETLYDHRMVPVGNGLDVEHVILILVEAIPEFCPDYDLVQMARRKAGCLATMSSDDDNYARGRSLSDEDLEDVAIILEDFLGSTDDLSPCLVAYVHTYIGLVRQYQERYSSAIVSLLKSLWIRKSAHQTSDRLAVSCHRLGLVYGLAREFDPATSLLQRAIDYYEQANIAKDHHFVVGAKKSLELFEDHRKIVSEEAGENMALQRPSLKLRQIAEGDMELLSSELS